MQLSDDDFTGKLQAAFGQRLGDFSRVGKRAAYPLALSKASRLIAGRCVLIGNAAHGLHPVAAQGFNLGLRDVAALSDCIVDAEVSDVGDADILDELRRMATIRSTQACAHHRRNRAPVR